MVCAVQALFCQGAKMITNFAPPPFGGAASFYLAMAGFMTTEIFVVAVVYFNGLGLLAAIFQILKENTPRRRRWRG